MTKTLYIHIGHYKTGTTALQVFLSQNPDFLSENGVAYPHLWRHNSKHSAFAFSILQAAGVDKLMYDYSDPTPPQDMWPELFNRVAEAKQDTTLISSEEFMRIGQFPKAQDILCQIMRTRPKDIQVKALAYLREPGAHVQSWYNQLIKMKFRVADLNHAVNGDIEDIHYDYQMALSPWIDILGPNNIIIRPYIKDSANPAALHQDFMGIFGIDLPTNLAKIDRDPNPRMDDRIVELVRLMQNTDLGRPTINAVRAQAAKYLEFQDRQIVRQGDGMTKARERARNGLEWLASQTGNHVDTAQFSQHLPEPTPQDQVDTHLLLGFIFSEFLKLRQRFNSLDLIELEQRIAALEDNAK